MIKNEIGKTSDEILSPREVSRWLKTSRAWPYTAVARGLLPYYKIGGKLLRFKKSEIEEFIERSKVK